MSSKAPLDPRIGTPEQFRWLLGIVKVVLALNLLDAIFTLFWINAGLAREANPLLAEIVRDHPVGFAIVKLGLVAGGSFLLWRYRSRPLAVHRLSQPRDRDTAVPVTGESFGFALRRRDLSVSSGWRILWIRFAASHDPILGSRF